MDIVFASGNKGKYREMRDAFAAFGINLVFGGDLDGPRCIEESGATYEENALLKARAWSLATGLPAMSDDSGLEVAALGGSPGIHSARIVPGSDIDRVKWLMEKMREQADRRARFVSCIAVVFPWTDEPIVYTGYCEGRIAESPSGKSGFGYDPVFIPDGYDMTFADLGEDVKKKISHRASAINGIAEMLLPVVQYYTVRTIDNSPAKELGLPKAGSV